MYTCSSVCCLALFSSQWVIDNNTCRLATILDVFSYSEILSLCYNGSVSGFVPSPCSHPPPGSVQRRGIYQQYSGQLTSILCVLFVVFLLFSWSVHVRNDKHAQCSFLIVSEVHKMHVHSGTSRTGTRNYCWLSENEALPTLIFCAVMQLAFSSNSGAQKQSFKCLLVSAVVSSLYRHSRSLELKGEFCVE